MALALPSQLAPKYISLPELTTTVCNDILALDDKADCKYLSKLIAGAPQVTTTTGGALVVSYMTDEDTSEHAW